MTRTSVAIIGAGQAGLAVSSLLTAASVEHVVLERDQIAGRWTSQRWDSMRLLTPNWMTRLPGWSYRGTDRCGYMTAAEVAGFLGEYAAAFDAPVVTGAAVRSVRRHPGGYAVDTDQGRWTADAVVVATGFCDQPAVPVAARDVDPRIVQITPDIYRNPGDLPAGGVLVVGASATGVQLAEEVARDGRPVLLAVGRHTRMVRRYRGMDIMWWLDAIGVLGRPRDPSRPRQPEEPSLQLVGHPDKREVDLPALAAHGVRFTGRFLGVEDRSSAVLFADDLESTTQSAQARITRLLQRIDQYATAAGLDGEVDRPVPLRPFTAGPVPVGQRRMDLWAAGVRSVIWATGYRRRYPWLHVPVLNARGDIRHTSGITAVPGLTVIGQQWQTRRNSTFLDGVGQDAALIVDHLKLGALAIPTWKVS